MEDRNATFIASCGKSLWRNTHAGDWFRTNKYIDQKFINSAFFSKFHWNFTMSVTAILLRFFARYNIRKVVGTVVHRSRKSILKIVDVKKSHSRVHAHVRCWRNNHQQREREKKTRAMCIPPRWNNFARHNFSCTTTFLPIYTLDHVNIPFAR